MSTEIAPTLAGKLEHVTFVNEFENTKVNYLRQLMSIENGG